MELLKVDLIEDALEKLAGYFKEPEVEEVGMLDSLNKTIAEGVTASENLPAFNRSTVDGYAVRSADTGGASENLPAFLEVAGEVHMGEATEMKLEPGQCVYVPTGGMVPCGADAMVMVEYCEPFGETSVAVYKAVSDRENMVMAGDDVKVGQNVLPRGKKIAPADLGVLSALGITKVKVYKPWKIAIISTGDEIVSPNVTPKLGQMRDVNTYGLLGEALEYGFKVVSFEVVCDDPSLLESKAAEAMKLADVVVLSGGSSKGKKDSTAAIIGKLASSGVLTHGLAVKPGKPTVLGYDEPSETALVGLPGHPVAALLLFNEIVGGLWERVAESDVHIIKPMIQGTMMANIAAAPGRKSYQLVKVKLEKGESEPKVYPVFGKSGLIRTLSEADGYIVIDVNEEGINRGEKVTVNLL